jgi:hypothetical protein
MHALRRVVIVAVSALAMVLAGTPAHAVDYSTTPRAVTSWKPDKAVYDILTVGDRVYIGGDFTQVYDETLRRYVPRQRLAAFDRTSGALLDWNPGANGTVRSLAAGPNGVVYAGGTFTRAAGVGYDTKLVAIGEDGLPAPRFRAAVKGDVRDMTVEADSLYISGGVSSISNDPDSGARFVGRKSVAKLDALTGALDRAFNARVEFGRVNAIKVESGTLVIGGTFTGLAGTPAQYLATVALDTGARVGPTFTPVCDTCSVFDLDTNVEGTVPYVYVAMGGGGGRVVKYSLTTGGQRVWIRSGDGDVQAIDVYDGNVYAGGHFGPTFSRTVRHQLAVLSLDGVLQPMTVPFTGLDKPGIWAVEADDRGLLLGGAFRGISGPVIARRFAELPVR